MTLDQPALTDFYVIAMRNAFTEVCADAKAELADCDHDMIDRISAMLATVPTTGSTSRPADVRTLTTACMMFTKALGRQNAAWFRSRTRQHLQRRPHVYDA